MSSVLPLSDTKTIWNWIIKNCPNGGKDTKSFGSGAIQFGPTYETKISWQQYDLLTNDVQQETYLINLGDDRQPDVRLLKFRLLPAELKKSGEDRKIQCNVQLIEKVVDAHGRFIKNKVYMNLHFDMPNPPKGRVVKGWIQKDSQ
jgi:hypothetical protein